MMKKYRGFSLLETLLAITVIVIAGIGVYAAFNSGLFNSNISDTTDEIVQIANVYTDLASSDLTGSTDIATLLQNSDRLSSKYFSQTASGVQMNNAYGALKFSNVGKYTYTVSVPLGCLPATSNVPEQLYNKVRDMYSCGGASCCDQSTHTCTNVTACTQDAPTYVTLDFNLSN